MRVPLVKQVFAVNVISEMMAYLVEKYKFKIDNLDVKEPEI
jgi:hypothetical protein